MRSFVEITVLDESGVETVQLKLGDLGGTNRFLFWTDGAAVSVWDMDRHPNWTGHTSPDFEMPVDGLAILSDGTCFLTEIVDVIVIEVVLLVEDQTQF